MKVVLRFIALMVIFGMNIPACHSGDSGPTGTKNKKLLKGDTNMMRTYHIGRFALDVPVEMKQAVQAQSFRYVEIEEFYWPKGEKRDEIRKAVWNEHLTTLQKLSLPKKKKSIVIAESEASIKEIWMRGVLYYGDYISEDIGYWDVLVDIGDTGVWLKYNGLLSGKEEMLKWLLEVASKLHPTRGYPPEKPVHNLFYLRYGVINLPYLEQEESYSRFEGHTLDLKLEVDMNETHEVETLGVAARLAASITTNFAPGVDVDRIRSRNRVAAELNGEELVMRVSAGGEDTQIQFGWEYRGKADSGEHPEIQITMETPDGNLDEKLKIWDAIIDSFKPMYR